MADSVGSVAFDLNLDLHDLDGAVSEAARVINNKLTVAFATAVKSCESKIAEMANAVGSSAKSALSSSESVKQSVVSGTTAAANSIKSAVEQATEKIESESAAAAKNSSEKIISEADKVQSKIQQILNNTEQSTRSKAGSIASIYKQQGMEQSDAIKKAWEQIKQTSTQSNSEQIKQSKKSWRSAVKDSQNGSSKIKKSFDGIGQKAKKSANKITSSFSGAFKKVGAAATAAFSAAAVIKFGKDCVESAASVSAANSQFAQTFGDLQSNAEAAMQKVAKASGIVQTRLQGVGTSIYAFAKTTGMDSANALSMMEEALQVTADSAAYYDRSLEDTAESLKSFLKGNYENDAALGLSCTETTRNAAANKLYGKSFQDLYEAQKQLTLLQMVKDANALSGAMGQAAREANGWENVTGNLKEAWNQLLAVVGQPILQAATVVIQQITSAIQTLTGYAKEATKALGELFGWGGDGSSNIASSVSSAASSASSLSDSTADSTKNLNNTAKAAEKVKKALAGFDQLNILSAGENDDTRDSEDTGGSAAFVTAPALDTSSTESDLNKSLDGMKSKLQSFFKDCGFDDFVSKIRQGISEVDFTAIGKNFESIAKSLQPIAESAAKGTQKVFKSSMSFLGSVAGGTVKIVGKSIQTVSGGVAKWLDQDKEKIVGYIDTISTNISSGLDNVSSFVDTVTTTAGNSIDRMRPIMENAISNMLSGITTFSGNMGVILSSAFNTASGVIAQWAIDNESKIGTFFDNIQVIGADCMNGIGTVFQDVGDTMLSWWNDGGGAELWESICKAFTDVQTIFIDVFNNYIMPIWETVRSAFESAWNDCLSPIFTRVMGVIESIGALIMVLWEKILKPAVNWIIEYLGPRITAVVKAVGAIFQTVFQAIGSIVSSVMMVFEGLIDFITGVFSGDWEKAWKGIEECFVGIFYGVWSVVKTVVNLIIDGINLLWSGIYYAVKGIIDGLGGIAGAVGDLFGQDWHFSMPSEPPLIPKLAKGGLAKAPTLAMVGDNPNAASDPEVISPLSKLKGMIADTQQTAVCDERIIRLLQRILQAIENQETDITNIIQMDGDVIERKLVKVRKAKSRRYGGATT